MIAMSLPGFRSAKISKKIGIPWGWDEPSSKGGEPPSSVLLAAALIMVHGNFASTEKIVEDDTSLRSSFLHFTFLHVVCINTKGKYITFHYLVTP